MELLFDKTNGVIFPEYGPNMMWNQKYGMRSGMRSRFTDFNYKGNMVIDKEKAIEISMDYLSGSGNDEFAGDEVHQYYGYYTIDTTGKDGATVGMLSVNGFTGQIWYHDWHETFIEKTEY